MNTRQDAEIIVAGSGLAGSTVLRHLLSHPSTQDKQILVVDRNHSASNDKTWCFWSDEDDFTESLVAHSWRSITVADTTGVYRYKLDQHRYKCIRSEDYLRACRNVIDAHSNVTRLNADILGFAKDETKSIVKTNVGDLRSTLVLQSVLKPEPIAKQRVPISLLQHFLGWEIETTHDVFDPEVAMFMDFRTDQKHGFAFVYVLPYSKRHALVEYTLFTPSTLEMANYEAALHSYIGDVLRLSSSGWKITRTEYGVIPMEDTKYPAWYTRGVLNMGMNGGQSKPSTGYTFSRVQHFAFEVAKSVTKRSMQDLNQQSSNRFMIYDRLILWLLRENPQVVPGIFVRLFEKNGADKMFKFLNEDTHLGEELSIMASTEWRHFFKAIWRSMVRR
jgi:lycopene beta-cyclase